MSLRSLVINCLSLQLICSLRYSVLFISFFLCKITLARYLTYTADTACVCALALQLEPKQLIYLRSARYSSLLASRAFNVYGGKSICGVTVMIRDVRDLLELWRGTEICSLSLQLPDVRLRTASQGHPARKRAQVSLFSTCHLNDNFYSFPPASYK